MRAEELIRRNIRRGARHVRFLALSEGALALALFAGWFLFVEVILDHILSLSAGTRAAMLVLLAASTVTVVIGGVALPIIRSINRLYIAQRVEFVFPEFKNSLVTYVQMERAQGDDDMLRLVAHQAARHFEGVNVDVALDSARFVRLGYAFVVLVVLVFTYSIVTPKSMWTSFVRALYPWENIAAPTRTHIRDVLPGGARIPQGADLAISATVSGAKEALVKWSRDGELWQAVPMEKVGDVWKGTLAHVETNVSYFVAAGDASSSRFNVVALLPPVVEAVGVDLTYPMYTGLAPRHLDDGNIEAPAGTDAAITVRSNKALQRVSLSLPKDLAVPLKVAADAATGRFTVTEAGRYSILLTDVDELTPLRPVQYDIVVLADRSPKVSIDGPKDGEKVQIEDAAPFRIDAADDYGLTKLVFHFEMNAGNADVKNILLPGDRREYSRTLELVPKLLGAMPGDTVTYYLEAFDNRQPKPNSARTPSYSFQVTEKESKPPLAAFGRTSGKPVQETNTTLPGKTETATGTPTVRQNAPSKSTAPANAAPNAKSDADAKADFTKMLKNDQATWDKIAKHLAAAPPTALRSTGQSGTPSTAKKTPSSDTPPASSKENTPTGEDGGKPNPSAGEQPGDPAKDAQQPTDSSAAKGGQDSQNSEPGDSGGQRGGDSQTNPNGGSQPSGKGGDPGKAGGNKAGAPNNAEASSQGAQSSAQSTEQGKDGLAAQAAQSGSEAQAQSPGTPGAASEGKASQQGGDSSQSPSQSDAKSAADKSQSSEDKGQGGEQSSGKDSKSSGQDGKSDSSKSKDGSQEAGAQAAESKEKDGSQEEGAPSSDSQNKEGGQEAGSKSEESRDGGEPSSGSPSESGAPAQSGEGKPGGQTGRPSQGMPSGSGQAGGETPGPTGSPGQKEAGAQSSSGGQSGSQPGNAKGTGGPGSSSGGQSPSSQGGATQQGGASQSSGAQGAPSQSAGTGSQGASSQSASTEAKEGGGQAQSQQTSQGTSSSITGGGASSGPVERAAVPETSKPGKADEGKSTTPGSGMSPAQLAATRQLLTRLKGDMAADKVDPSLLADLGWKPSDLATFVRKYEDVFKDVDLKPFDGPLNLDGQLNPGEAIAGDRGADAIGSVDTGGDAAKKDAAEALKDLPREEVSPQYKKLVDEYYRSLTQSRE